MTAPVIRQFVGTIPDKGQSQTAFDTNVDAFLDWQALQFAPDLVAFGTFAQNTAAALVAANLPSLTGQALDAVRVNAAGDDVEFADVTAAGWALLDDADAAAQRTTLGAVALASPTFTGVPAAPTAAAATNTTQLATTAYTRTAIPNVLNASGAAPIYACRAWVNFNGTGTVAIRGSGNVSSITDNGTGDYTINFATALPDTDYAVAFAINSSTTSSALRQAVIRASSSGDNPTTKTASALRIITAATNAQSLFDMNQVNVVIFR